MTLDACYGAFPLKPEEEKGDKRGFFEKLFSTSVSSGCMILELSGRLLSSFILEVAFLSAMIVHKLLFDLELFKSKILCVTQNGNNPTHIFEN